MNARRDASGETPAAPRHREEALLVMACTAPEDAPAQRAIPPSTPAPATAIDWDHVIDRAEMLGVAPLLYHHVEDDRLTIPADAHARLRAAYYQAAARNAALHEALWTVVAALTANRIDAVLLKGVALAETVYANIGLRPMRDLDLLVRVADAERAERVLISLGYRPYEEFRPRGWYAGHHHLVPYLAPRGPAVVELHRGLLPERTKLTVPVEPLWQRVRRVEIAGRPVHVPAPDDLLLHICLHLAASDRFHSGLRALRDIGEILLRCEGDLDWDRLGQSLRGCGGVIHGYAALRLAHDLCAARVPDVVLRVLAQDARLGRLEEKALFALAHRLLLRGEDDGHGTVPGDVLQNACEEFLARKSWGRRAITMGRIVMERWFGAGRARGWGPLSPLYGLVIHPLVVAARAARRRVGGRRA